MTRPNENWEGRDVISFGPKFRIDTANPQMGDGGSVVYMLYAVTDNKEQQLCALSESGTYHIHNDGKIEMIGGLNRQAGGVDIQISTKKGDITITANENGQVRIKGSSVEIKSDSPKTSKSSFTNKLSISTSPFISSLPTSTDEFPLPNIIFPLMSTSLRKRTSSLN